MNQLVLIVVFFAVFTNSNAQYVTIPDANFVTWLNSHGYSNCLNGNQLDTVCAATAGTTTINCSNGLIRNLTGLQYFKKVTVLTCSYDSLVTLPPLPHLLQSLDCQNNQLTVLPILPKYLTTLTCSSNKLTTLPMLPDSLRLLDCRNNRSIQSLPPLPSILSTLYCTQNNLTSLPILPPTISYMRCDHNALTSLPTLPQSLKFLMCGGNQLTSIPNIPPKLFQLYCNSNQLTALPALNSDSLTSLYCERNHLAALPALPPRLVVLDCSDNNLSVIPTLPATLSDLKCANNNLSDLPILPARLYSLVCSKNNLTFLRNLPLGMKNLYCDYNYNIACLPYLPDLQSLNFDSTAVTCVPNYPYGISSSPDITTFPVCDMFNAQGCNSYSNISGTAYNDANNNCIQDSLEASLAHIKILLFDSAGVLRQQTYTNADGLYIFPASAGSYKVMPDTAGLHSIFTCPVSGYYTTNLGPFDSVSYNNNFGFICNVAGFDLGVQHLTTNSQARPGQYLDLQLGAGDAFYSYMTACAPNVGGTVTLNYTGPAVFHLAGPGATAPFVVGRTLTWPITNFSTINSQYFNAFFKIDTGAVIGDVLCFTVIISANTPADINSNNDRYTFCIPVSNSYDPNIKAVLPAGDIYANQNGLTYTVHFQNTGNAEALNIYIDDTLDAAHLDISTFKLLATSHNAITQLLEGGIARFNFPNINLPDSNTSERASHGYVQYKINLKNNQPTGTQINNTAHIYFDLNTAIVTNTTLNTIVAGSTTDVIKTPEYKTDFQLSPNPTAASVTVSIPEDLIGGKLTITDILGRQASPLPMQLSGLQLELPVAELSNGIYFVSITKDGKAYCKKLVVSK